MQKKTMLILSVCLMLIMASCSKKGNNTPTEDKRPTITAHVQEVPNLRSMFAESRVSLVPGTGPEKGLDIKWVIGETKVVSTIFRQGSKTVAGWRVNMTIIEESDDSGKKSLKGTFTAPVPDGIDPTKPFEIAGVIGTESYFNDDGTIAIDMRHNIQSNEVPPMYFSFMKAELDTENPNRNNYIVKPYFKFYGSILHFNVINPMHDPILIPKMKIKTKMISSYGTMNFNTDTESPTWTDNSTDIVITNGNEFRLDGDYFVAYGQRKYGQKKNGQKLENSCMIWGKPLGQGGKEMDITLNTAVGDQTVSFSASNSLKDNKVYDIDMKMPIEGDLIITSYYSASWGTRGALSIYNGTDHDIDITDYYLIRADNFNYNYDTAKAITMQLDSSHGIKGIKKKIAYNRQDENSNILKPGMIVIYTSDQVTNDITRDWQDHTPPSLAYQFIYDGSTDARPGTVNTAAAIKAQSYDFLALAKGNAASPNYNEIVDALFRERDGVARYAKFASKTYIRKEDRVLGSQYDYRPWRNWEESRDLTNYIQLNSETNYGDLGYRFRYYHNGNKVTNGDPGQTLVSVFPVYIYKDIPYTPKSYWNLTNNTLH